MAILSMHIVAPVPPMKERNPSIDVPKPIEDLVRALLEKDVKVRPQHRSRANRAHRSRHGRERDLAAVADLRISLVAAPISGSDVTSGTRSWQRTDALAPTIWACPHRAPSRFARATSGSIERVKGILLGPRHGLGAGALFLFATFAFMHRWSENVARDADGSPGTIATTAKVAALRATPEALRSATGKGTPALEHLAAEFPSDPRSTSSSRRPSSKRIASTTRSPRDPNAGDTRPEFRRRPARRRGRECGAQGQHGGRRLRFARRSSRCPRLRRLARLSTTRTVPPALQRRAAKSIARAEVRTNASPAASNPAGFSRREDRVPIVTSYSSGPRTTATHACSSSSRICASPTGAGSWGCATADHACAKTAPSKTPSPPSKPARIARSSPCCLSLRSTRARSAAPSVRRLLRARVLRLGLRGHEHGDASRLRPCRFSCLHRAHRHLRLVVRVDCRPPLLYSDRRRRCSSLQGLSSTARSRRNDRGRDLVAVHTGEDGGRRDACRGRRPSFALLPSAKSSWRHGPWLGHRPARLRARS